MQFHRRRTVPPFCVGYLHRRFFKFWFWCTPGKLRGVLDPRRPCVLMLMKQYQNHVQH